MNNRAKIPLLVDEPEALYRIPAASPGARAGSSSVVERIRAGLPYAEFKALGGLLGLSAEELAGCLAISRSTLLRRRKQGRLTTEESDRLVRFARLYGRALEVLGSAEATRAWLKTPARALGGDTPLFFAGTETGAREVENLLGRLEYSVYT